MMLGQTDVGAEEGANVENCASHLYYRLDSSPIVEVEDFGSSVFSWLKYYVCLELSK